MRTVVTSYPNPDTDGIACIVALSECFGYLPLMRGNLSSESVYVLKKLGLKAPIKAGGIEDKDRIVLVDTHNPAQLGDDFPVDKVVEIIDHHPSGDMAAFKNAKIDNRKIGAAASIVGEMVLREGGIDDKICRLLQFAIASNTLNFTAPSTSAFDKNIYDALNAISPVLDYELGEMFAQRSEDDIFSDIKYFDFRGGRIAILQIERFGLKLSVGEVKDFLTELDNVEGLLFSVFNGVDIGKKESTVVFSDGIGDAEASGIFSFDVRDGVYKADKILLRKTDFNL